MGNYRSRSGCLTCRARRVKCDETRPVCKACSKKNRPCQWDAPQNKFKVYQPHDATSKRDADSEAMELDDGSEDGQPRSRTFSPNSNHSTTRTNSRSEENRDTRSSMSGPSPSQHSPDDEPAALRESRRHSAESKSSSSSALQPQSSQGTHQYLQASIPLSHEEAILVHHYTEYLGRWLDCTDATRQFTLGVPDKVKNCSVLRYAVLSFAARHRREKATAEAAYNRCIALLIVRLNEVTASHDETLLCAIVILRFYEQLTVPSNTGSDDEQHLAGSSAILRASQGHHYVDPSAPTLREAAFWVYVRQCLYNATIHQQPPDIDFSLQLHPTPGSMQDAHPLARLRLETAWANQMTWNLAHVVNYCFDTSDSHNEQNYRSRRWQELWDQVEQWATERPEGFNPIWQDEAGKDGPFPEVWFTTDWHVISCGFYHFACILLLTYKPGPRFAIRNTVSLSDTNQKILKHARVICGACKCSPKTVPLSITVCHTIFIWGPLVTDQNERDEITKLLVIFEQDHLWPTTWIINALRKEWGMS